MADIFSVYDGFNRTNTERVAPPIYSPLCCDGIFHCCPYEENKKTTSNRRIPIGFHRIQTPPLPSHSVGRSVLRDGDSGLWRRSDVEQCHRLL